MSAIAKIHHIQLAHNNFALSALGGCYWRELDAILITDTHLGKTNYFNQHNIPIPREVLIEQFQKMDKIVKQFQCSNIFILGDMFHHEDGLDKDFLTRFSKWHKKNRYSLTCIEGNHDRYIPHELFHDSVVFRDSLLIDDNILLTHDYSKEDRKFFQISGHRHPRFKLKEGKNILNLPCFWSRKDSFILPAFSTFSSGVEINSEWKKNDRAYLLIDDEYIAEVKKEN